MKFRSLFIVAIFGLLATGCADPNTGSSIAEVKPLPTPTPSPTPTMPPNQDEEIMMGDYSAAVLVPAVSSPSVQSSSSALSSSSPQSSSPASSNYKYTVSVKKVDGLPTNARLMKVIISLKVGSNASSVVYSDVAALGSAEDTWGEWIVLTSKAKQVPIISQRAIIFRVFGLKTSNLQYRSYSLSIRGCAQIGGGMGCSSYIEEHTLPVELSKSIAVDP